MADLLTKVFVLVKHGTSVTLDSIKTESEGNKKIYFVEDLNQIVLNGRTYGIDPKTSTEITSLISAIGGSVNPENGTVTVDFKNTNYASTASNIVAAIGALDTKLKGELDKLAASNTLNENYEFTGSIKYVAAKDGVAAHIALCDDAGAELSKVEVSSIIGNGVLKSSSYNKETGELSLTFAQANGVDKTEKINLADMLDINDVKIADDSQNYMGVDLTGGENSQAVFSIKVSKMADSTLTGLADAKDVKDYVDSKAIDLAIDAAGDEYITAAVDRSNNKKINVTADVKNVTYNEGTHATYDDKGAKLTEPTAATISGVANSLIDGAQATDAIKSYIDFVVAEEALRADNKVLAYIKGLDKASDTVNGTNIHIDYKEEDGIVTIESVTEDYATVAYIGTTSTPDAPLNNTSLTVTAGDEDKLVKASDLKAVADYAADKVTEETHRVDKKIKDLAGSATGSDTGKYISVKVDSTSGEVTGVTVEFDPWETYGEVTV